MDGYWILDEGRQAVQVDMPTWARFFENIENRRVAWTEVAPGISVSTVFLGLNHAFGGGPPLLFETMCFDDYGEPVEPGMERYSTWAAAIAGHNDAVEQLLERMGLPLPAMPVIGR
ncbi:hypothetical protein O4H52_07815 [Sphingomonadaceae bacterium G21617-S1]|nr:hypothetical protein [Sphingomonadaceae bacterium G21617-S1]